MRDVVWTLLAMLVLVSITGVMGCVSAYRNGARDGWRAANHRNDPLWNDLRKWLMPMCGCSDCAKERA